jgi:hypothetical protein
MARAGVTFLLGFLDFPDRAEERAPNEQVRVQFFIESYTFAAFAFGWACYGINMVNAAYV